MRTSRLEAFSDGVLAIIITIMVLELHIPEGTSFEDLTTVLPTLIAYVLSFIYIGIYWNNHHHFWQAVQKISGGALWANLHLLFWLSLFPFTTAWLGENHLTAVPVAIYGFVLLMASVAWYIMALVCIKAEGKKSILAIAYKGDNKTKFSALIYASAMAVAFLSPTLSCVLYGLIAIAWLVPDKRIEKALKAKESGNYEDLIA